MKNQRLQEKLNNEVLDFIESRKTLQLASINEDGTPYASYAPFAIGNECLYVLLSDIAVHGSNLYQTPTASVLIVQDEDSCDEIFARIRVNYAMKVEHLSLDSEAWFEGLDALMARHGDRISQLSQLSDFKLFKLVPSKGRFVKGFAKAYSLLGNTLAGEDVQHLSEGHKRRLIEND
jgi:heme iron utilization protein